MSSTGVEYVSGGGGEKGADMEKSPAAFNEPGRRDSVGRRVSTANTTYDSTHRKLKARHIQLIGIGCAVPLTREVK
jgi:amino acid permease